MEVVQKRKMRRRKEEVEAQNKKGERWERGEMAVVGD